MVDMTKMKEQALQRKREHEERELRKQMGGSKSSSRRPSSRSDSRGRSRAGGRSNPSAQRALAQQQARPKKRKRSISRWVLDILLVLGALLVMVIVLNPFR